MCLNRPILQSCMSTYKILHVSATSLKQPPKYLDKYIWKSRTLYINIACYILKNGYAMQYLYWNAWYISIHECLWDHNYCDHWGHDLTFTNINDVGMVQFGHDFDFSSDSVDFCFIVNLQLFDVFNCHLQKKSRKI